MFGFNPGAVGDCPAAVPGWRCQAAEPSAERARRNKGGLMGWWRGAGGRKAGLGFFIFTSARGLGRGMVGKGGSALLIFAMLFKYFLDDSKLGLMGCRPRP